MLTKILDGLGTTFATQWSANLLTAAFVFWSGGLLVLAWHFGWSPLDVWYMGLSATVEVVVLVAAFLLVALSSIVSQRLNLPVLRFLEGYWPGWLSGIRRWLVGRVATTYQQKLQTLQTLAGKGLPDLSTDELKHYVELDRYITHMPTTPEVLMPTRLGNILRAAELRSRNKYGLDAVICWPRLWLLLPDAVKQELMDARASLDTSVNLLIWSMLFLVWTLWAWWALLVTVLVAMYAYSWSLRLAEVYGELIDSCYDLHRGDLYQALRWPLPANPAAEQQTGLQLTQYIWRGSDAQTPTFVVPKS